MAESEADAGILLLSTDGLSIQGKFKSNVVVNWEIPANRIEDY